MGGGEWVGVWGSTIFKNGLKRSEPKVKDVSYSLIQGPVHFHFGALGMRIPFISGNTTAGYFMFFFFFSAESKNGMLGEVCTVRIPFS